MICCACCEWQKPLAWSAGVSMSDFAVSDTYGFSLRVPAQPSLVGASACTRAKADAERAWVGRGRPRLARAPRCGGLGLYSTCRASEIFSRPGTGSSLVDFSSFVSSRFSQLLEIMTPRQ